MRAILSRPARDASNRLRWAWVLSVCVLACPCARAVGDEPQTLTARLLAEDPAALGARIDGDARRGAIVFHRSELLCASCHTAQPQSRAVGPELARGDPTFDAKTLVTSLLEPSRVISEGYESVTVVTKDGRVITGVRPDQGEGRLHLLDAAQPGQSVEVPLEEIEERRDGGASVMPAGLIDTLTSRGEFVDLLRYLIEIGEGGPERARALRPSPFEMSKPPLPDYERQLDHAGLIADLGPVNLDAGRGIYARACASCHGTPSAEGSLPTSPKFWADRLKSGGDPLKMYETITGGQGLMPPHTWLVPRQKYDVIYYIREHYLKERNASQYLPIDAAYLAALPKGAERGPEPAAAEPWVAMDYGNALLVTLELGRDSGTFAYKGIAIRLDPGTGGVAQGERFAVYDHDTMNLVGAWQGKGFIDWRSIIYNGEHEIHPATVGRVLFRNATWPAWANPADGSTVDPRIEGRDGKRYGPLPRDWLRYRGHYVNGGRVILSYFVGDAEVLESPGAGAAGEVVRELDIGPSRHALRLRLGTADNIVAVETSGDADVALAKGDAWLRVPPRDDAVNARVRIGSGAKDGPTLSRNPKGRSLRASTEPGAPQWPQVVETQVARFDDEGPFGIDVLALPDANPWRAQVRPTGFDFLDADRAAVCTWDGDVWTVSGLQTQDGTLQWRRIAAGLFQPLGLKVIGGAVHVGCRDQIVILRDRNGDGETDFYECFNSDHQVTEHFHEFAMGLQTDAGGNLIYAKAARHGAQALVPQHGTLLRVERDGSATSILARGFRAPNGVCVNDDGTFFVTDQEGHWIPKNRLNWIDSQGDFYGNMWAYHDVTDASDAAMKPPVSWITNTFDRSPAEPLWVTSERWGPLQGTLLSLSYGYGQIYLAPHEKVGGVMQGAMAPLPLPRFPTGLVRGRFGPADGQLYVCGMYSWAGSQTRPGGFFRIRAKGSPVHLPVEVHARSAGLELRFSDPLDRAVAEDLDRYQYRSWGLRRSRNYGSPHVNEQTHRVIGARLADDAKTLRLEIEGFSPTAGYELRYNLRGAAGEPASNILNGTVHAVGPE